MKTLMLALLILLPVVAVAQTHRGSIRGTIFDPNKAVVVGAEVKLVNLSTRKERTVQSGPEGDYSIASIEPGSYSLEVRTQGFEAFAQEFEIHVNQELRMDANLLLPAISGDRVSTAVTRELKQDNASLGTVIENRQVSGLPLDGRNFYELSLLVPGAARLR